MDRFDQVGPEEHDRFVAAAVAAPAKCFVGEVHVHQFGAHGAVENENALGQGRKVGGVHRWHYARFWTSIVTR